ncbi:MAG: HIT family protein [Lachnospiraceae bacterium]|nr:HIT family protein [Lachnospiraceae bacterium]
MKDSNCIFCKIANGEIPSRTIEENDMFKVVLDVGPATKGHALILPKDHYTNLYDLPEDVAAEVYKTAKKIALKMKEKLGCDGVNIVQNNEEAAGQTVFHFHMHVIPRYKDDGQVIGWKPGQPTAEELDAIAEVLK